MHDTRIMIEHGNKKAAFINDGHGWCPEWFYEEDRPMLRFKDHEWLSIGHVKPTHAAECTPLHGGGYLFTGCASYGSTPVQWTVKVMPDPEAEGFVIECDFTPARSVELLEAYSTFETPYEYAGGETVTTVIGMNPVVRWKGTERISPPVWQHPAWMYSRPQSVRCTAPCTAPYLCQAITDVPGVADRYVTLAADWTVCRAHDVYMTPTQTAPSSATAASPEAVWKRGYKYIVGALNWSSAFAKDPNVLYAGGKAHKQRVAVDFRSCLGGQTFDELLLRAWRRAAAFSRPADGRIAAFDRALEKRVGWQTAVEWLRNIYVSDKPTPGIFKPDRGICTYAVGTRPKAPDDYNWRWWTQWAGPLHYRARLTGDRELEAACDRHDEKFAEAAGGMRLFNSIAGSVPLLPTIWWIRGGGRNSLLHAAMRPVLENMLETSRRENGQVRTMDHGFQAAVAEALLLAGEAYAAPAMIDQAHLLIEEMNAMLSGDFWAFNCGRTGSLEHGGQIRSMGHGHAIMANLLAARQSGEPRFLQQAHCFARYLLAVNYACHNDSADPDFDWRGWCNGSNAGRDQIAEFPPWETQNGLLCIAALMTDLEVEDCFEDALWYIARTGLAQFPAARQLKRVLDEDMRVHFVARGQIASERDFYDTLPFLAYENPHDQTLLAPYQGSDCLLGELVYGGGLASATDPRIGVLTPRAATMDMAEETQRLVRVWNPTADSIETEIRVNWFGAPENVQSVMLPGRSGMVLRIDRR